MEVINSGRGRGFTLLRTDKGTRRLCPCNIGEARLAREREFKDNLYDAGFTRIDRCVADRDGELITCDRYGNPYILMEYFEGRECNPNHIEELEAAAKILRNFIRQADCCGRRSPKAVAGHLTVNPVVCQGK